MKIILIGKTTTGKDTVANELCKRYGYKLAKSHTTRPKRKSKLPHTQWYVDSIK